MNTKQLSDWNQLVRQCKTQCARRPYNSINVASIVRSEAIVAADALVELVTLELAALLERLARHAISVHFHTKGYADWANQYRRDAESADSLAARIREALALEENDAQKT